MRHDVVVTGRATESGAFPRYRRTHRQHKSVGCGGAGAAGGSEFWAKAGYRVHRYYDPSTAQFLSVDPLVAVTGDAFGYAAEDPVNDTDMSGLSPSRQRPIQPEKAGEVGVKISWNQQTGEITATGWTLGWSPRSQIQLEVVIYWNGTILNQQTWQCDNGGLCSAIGPKHLRVEMPCDTSEEDVFTAKAYASGKWGSPPIITDEADFMPMTYGKNFWDNMWDYFNF